jgi:hypothetical protein
LAVFGDERDELIQELKVAEGHKRVNFCAFFAGIDLNVCSMRKL